MSSLDLESGRAYLEALRRDPKQYAAVPIAVAADALGVAKTTIERMIKDGRLVDVRIKLASRVANESRCVAVAGLLEILDSRSTQERVVEVLLTDAARRRRPVFYDDVMQPIGLRSDRSVDRRRIGEILDAISRRSYAHHGFMLSVLVHRKPSRTGQESKPSDGFFKLADKLKLNAEQHTLFSEQIDRVFRHFAESNRSK